MTPIPRNARLRSLDCRAERWTALDKSIAGIVSGLDFMLTCLPQVALANETVSQWSVGMQIEHALLVDAVVLTIIRGEMADLATDAPPNFAGRMVLLVGVVPRGKGQAPDSVKPQAVDIDTLPDRIAGLKASVEQLQELLPAIVADKSRFAHPMFGGLTRAQWLRLMRVHQDHHCDIVRDILRLA